MDKISGIRSLIALQNGMTLENWTLLGYLAIHNVSRGRVQGLEGQDFDNTFFCCRAFIFEIFKMNKTGVIYMSVAFHSRIECENRPKNE